MKFNPLKTASILLKVFILVLPFQIRTLVFNNTYLLTGNFNEYTSFFIYPGDLLLLGAFLCYAYASFRGEAKPSGSEGDGMTAILILLYAMLVLAGVFFADYALLVLLNGFRLLEFYMLYYLITRGVLKKDEILNFFVYSILIQSFVAIEQYLFQSSVGLRLLGEPAISPEIPGVAKVDLDGTKVMRAYGTFLHPNILGGFLVVAIFWSSHVFKKNLWLMMLVVGVLLLALILTFSRSAMIALAGAVLVYFSISNKKFPWKHILFWLSLGVLFVVIFNLEGVFFTRVLTGDIMSDLERGQFLAASKNMFLANPFGVGSGHFTVHMQSFLADKLSPWTMQPVHNLYLIVFNENGILGGTVFIALLGYLFAAQLKSLKKLEGDDKDFVYVQLAVLSAVFIMGLFDHYFYSFYQGLALLFIYFALSSSLISKSLLPRIKS